MAELEAKAGGSPPTPAGRSWGDDLIRQFGLTARHGLEGVGGALDFASSPIRAGLNALLPKQQTMGGMVQGQEAQPAIQGNSGAYVANKLGLPSPENPTERVVGDITSTMASSGGLGAGARALSTVAPKAALPILEWLQANQGTQAISSAGGGAGTGIARESGAGPVGQTAAGLAGAIAAPLGVSGAKAIGGKLADLGSTILASFGHQPSIERLAGEAVTKASGSQRDALITALNNATEYVPGVKPTVGEAITEANMKSPTQFGGSIVKLQKDLTGARGIEDVLPSVAKQQQSALEAPVISMAGGNTQQQRAKTLEMADAMRKQVTDPMRETALENANIAGIKVPELQARIAEKAAQSSGAVEDVRRLSNLGVKAEELGLQQPRLGPDGRVPGLPRGPSQYSYGTELSKLADKHAAGAADLSLQRGAERRFLENQLGSLEAHGLRPLDATKITGHIEKILSTPGDRAVTLNEKVLSAVRDKINEVAAKNGGQLDAHDLYAIRKTDINDVVKSLTKDLDAATKNRAATLATTIKGRIDSAIEAAGGTGWKDYLKKYADLSAEIDQKKVAGAILEKMRSDSGKATPSQLLKVLGSGEDSMLKNSMGGPRATEIEQVFSPEKAALLRQIEKHLQRSEEMNRIAAGIKRSTAGEMVAGEIPHAPTLLSRPMMLANWLMRGVSGGAETPVAKFVAEQMKDPKEFAKLIGPQQSTLSQRASEVAKRAALAAALSQENP